MSAVSLCRLPSSALTYAGRTIASSTAIIRDRLGERFQDAKMPVQHCATESVQKLTLVPFWDSLQKKIKKTSDLLNLL
jgi:hypothetical protein